LIAAGPTFATLLFFRLKTRRKRKYSGEEIGGRDPERLGIANYVTSGFAGYFHMFLPFIILIQNLPAEVLESALLIFLLRNLPGEVLENFSSRLENPEAGGPAFEGQVLRRPRAIVYRATFLIFCLSNPR
jgi:hypothetical protein